MITRHMRTHTRYGESHSIDDGTGGTEVITNYASTRSISTDSAEANKFVKEESDLLPSPGSPMDTAEENK